MKVAALALFVICTAVPASAGGVIADPQLRDPLVIARAADVLRKACPDYSVNMFTALREMRAHERLARSRGMTTEEIRAALKAGPARKDIYKRAEAMIASLPGTSCQKADALVARHPLAARLISR